MNLLSDELSAGQIVFNGKIVTVDPIESIVGTFAVKQGKILTVGPEDHVMRCKGAKTDEIREEISKLRGEAEVIKDEMDKIRKPTEE